MSDLYGFTPSNTMGSVTFDVLNYDGIEDPLIDTNRLATLDLEECYFKSAVDFITESNKEFTDSKITLYNKILETTSTTVIHESFSDFFVKVKEIINKFLKFIKSLFQRFLTQLARIIGSDKYLEKHKKDFDKFKDGDKFKIDGYKYTFSDNIPVPDALVQYNFDLFDHLLDFEDDTPTNNMITVENISKARTDLSDRLTDYYNDFRGRVLAKEDQKIYEVDYSDALFKVFRDDSTTTEIIDIDRSTIRLVIDRYFKFNKMQEYTNKQYKAIESAYKKVEEQIKDLVKRNGDLSYKVFVDRLPDGSDARISYTANTDNDTGVAMASDVLTQLDMYVKVKTEQIQECSNIHTLAFAAKLDALKECAKQDKETLYKALSRVQRTDAKRAKEEY